MPMATKKEKKKKRKVSEDVVEETDMNHMDGWSV